MKGPTVTEIDTSTDFGARVSRRLDEERIIWLTTVRPDGRPEPSPVWFLWDGETFLIYSEPSTVKLRNIAAQPHVSLHMHGDFWGNDIVIFSGEARIDDDASTADGLSELLRKYKENLDQPGGPTTEAFTRDYSVAIRVTPTKLRGF
jgi:PPOX class probable F420-dependent enzyme